VRGGNYAAPNAVISTGACVPPPSILGQKPVKLCLLVPYDGWLWQRQEHPVSPPSRPGGPSGNPPSPIADPR